MLVEARFLDEKSLRSKVKIQLNSIEELKMVANNYTEVIIKCSTGEKEKTAYYIILPDKYFVYIESYYETKAISLS